MSQARKIVQDFKKGMGALNQAMPETIPAMTTFMGVAAKEGSMK